MAKTNWLKTAYSYLPGGLPRGRYVGPSKGQTATVTGPSGDIGSVLYDATKGLPANVMIGGVQYPINGQSASQLRTPGMSNADFERLMVQSGQMTPAGGTDGTAGGGTTGGTAGAYQPDMVEYPQGSGFYYDLNNPAEKQSFYDRRLADLQQARDQQIAGIDQSIADLLGSSKDYVTNYFKQLDAFGQAKGAGDTSRISLYSQASPNAFQSSEATSYDVANTNYLKGLGDAAQQANEAVGAGYLANPTDQSLLGADTTYGRQLQNYFAGKNDIGNQFNDIYAGLQQQNNPATNPFRFDYQAAGLTPPAAVDMRGYTPSVGFNQVASTATPGPGFKPAGGYGFGANTPVEPFLGSTKLDQHSTDYLRKYLLGQA